MGPPSGWTERHFAGAMARLGPFGARPAMAVAVSGGPDSLALAVLADDWARARGGSVLALIVDHGLRPESGAEAAGARDRLAALGIAARMIAISVGRGPALAERARLARHAALAASCREAGLVHLLLGHHADDQAETLLERAVAGSGADGFAGMAGIVWRRDVALARPMLRLPGAATRALLRGRGVGWAEDPTNRDAGALRWRLRAGLPDPGATRCLGRAARVAGRARAAAEAEAVDWLGRFATIRPEGFAVVPSGPMPPRALASLLRMVAGAVYPPPEEAVTALAAAPRPATLAGARLMTAGRLGPGWLLLREAAAMAPSVPCVAGAIWDGRFLVTREEPGAMIGPLGADAARFGRLLPKAVLRTLPAIRAGDGVAVPHMEPGRIGEPGQDWVRFAPPVPAGGGPFVAR